jgi:hypothetical protein
VLSLPERHREDHQPVFVDQSVAVKQLDQLAAAIDQEIRARLLLQPRDRGGEAPCQQSPIPRDRLLQRPRGDELRKRVHPHGELALRCLQSNSASLAH